jgi:hypothetical protein
MAYVPEANIQYGACKHSSGGHRARPKVSTCGACAARRRAHAVKHAQGGNRQCLHHQRLRLRLRAILKQPKRRACAIITVQNDERGKGGGCVWGRTNETVQEEDDGRRVGRNKKGKTQNTKNRRTHPPPPVERRFMAHGRDLEDPPPHRIASAWGDRRPRAGKGDGPPCALLHQPSSRSLEDVYRIVSGSGPGSGLGGRTTKGRRARGDVDIAVPVMMN